MRNKLCYKYNVYLLYIVDIADHEDLYKWNNDSTVHFNKDIDQLYISPSLR